MIAEILLSMMAVATTDQTVNVAKGTKLAVNNFAGDVIIKTWDKDAVRVQVNHSDRETVDIKQADQTLSVRSRSTRGGPSRSLDYDISVPAWMSVSVNGTYADVTAEGLGGDIAVETTHGDITVRGGSGFISLKTIQGQIVVEKAKGRVEVRAINEGVRLADISGDLSAESTNGSIILDRIDSANVDLYTVNGNISFDGPIKDKGLYRLTTHNGMIAMPIAERANVTLSARTYNGSIRSSFQLPPDPSTTPERRSKRFTLTLGNGSAHVELESFGGSIALRRPGEARPETERRRQRGDDSKDKDKEKEKDKGKDGMALAQASIPAAMAAARAALPEALAAAQAAMPAAMAEARAAMPEAMAEAQRAVQAAMADVQRSMPNEIDWAISGVPDAIERALEAVHEALPRPRPDPRPMPEPRPRPEPRPEPRPQP